MRQESQSKCRYMGFLKKVKDKTEESVKKVGEGGAKLGKKGLKETKKTVKKSKEESYVASR